MAGSILVICAAVAFVGVNSLYQKSDDVVELTAANFNNLVINSDELWMVEFYAPWCGHCKSLAPEWKKAASALKGVVKVGAVDMDVHGSVGGPYNVKGFPTLKIFGANKKSPKDYNGARNAQGIVDSALSNAKSMVSDRLSGKSSGGGRSQGGGSGGSGDAKDVITLTDENFEKLVLNSKDIWLIEFFAPWCGHCQRLAPEWQKAATELKGKVKLGAVDCTVHTITAGRYQVQGYPTIKMFQGGEMSEYDGGRTASDIVTWGLDKASKNIAPPEIKQITDESVLKEACNDSPLCVVAVLPHILDCQSKCRNKYLAVLKTMGEKYKAKLWGWVWVEAGQQTKLEEALDIGGFGYPAMAVVNARKKKFSLLKGSFGTDGISEFLRAIAVGRGSTMTLKGSELPSIVKVDKWDGKDAILEVEEDIDLSDVELDDLDSVKEEL